MSLEPVLGLTSFAHSDIYNEYKRERVSNKNHFTKAYFITCSQCVCLCISTGCENMVVIETHGDRLSERKAKAIEQKLILNTLQALSLSAQ